VCGTGQSSAGELVCSYCRSPLPPQVRPNSGLWRCPKCRRVMLVHDRIARMVLGEDRVVEAWIVPLAITGPIALLVLFGAPFTGSGLFAIPACLCCAAFFGYWAYDGYLGIVTRMHRFAGLGASRGRAAVYSGVWGLLIGLLGVIILSYVAVALFLREATGRWPFP